MLIFSLSAENECSLDLNKGAGFRFLLACFSIICCEEAIAAAAYSCDSLIFDQKFSARFNAVVVLFTSISFNLTGYA